MNEENKINFWSINTKENTQESSNTFLETEKEITQTNEQKSIIWEINKNNNTDNQTQNTIDLSSINIEKDTKKEKPKINFFNKDVSQKEKKHYHVNYRKIFILSFFVILISLIVWFGALTYKKYLINYSSSETSINHKWFDTINKIKSFVEQYTTKNNTHNASDKIILEWPDGIKELNSLINSELNYIKTKELLNDSIVDLNNSILNKHNELENTKKEITKAWFVSKEIEEIVSQKQDISSIQDSLTSLEAIKFSSAINVFSYLDTFIESLSQSLEISKETIEETMAEIINRKEKDINIYIKNCYLNPYEIDYNCENTKDFDIYYQINKDNYFDTDLFKKLMHYIDIKLEQTELPSFSIFFKNFDQNKNTITFDINVNTFKQDEIELAKKWILSPHIFVFTNLINSLKQSKFIVGENISTNNLQIENKTIEIWTTKFNVNSSKKSLTLPIQKNTEVEISDFTDNK